MRTKLSWSRFFDNDSGAKRQCKHKVEYWKALLERALESNLSDFSDTDKTTLKAFRDDLIATIAYEHTVDHEQGIAN